MTLPAKERFEVIDRYQMNEPDCLIVHYCEDCACPLTIPLQPASGMQEKVDLKTAYGIAPELRSQPLRENYWSVFNPTGNHGVVVLNQAAFNLLKRFQRAKPLSQEMIHYSDMANLKEIFSRLIYLGILREPGDIQKPYVNSQKVVTVWLHITNQCNLRCTYCYLSKTNDAMSLTVGQKAIDAAIRAALRGDYNALKLKYAGGEASLKMERVFQIHDYAVYACRKQKLGIQAVILSNGILLNEKSIKRLKERGIKVMLSLDGLGRDHDVQRPFGGGQNSAQLVIESIDRLVENGLPPHLSITISDQNCDTIHEVVDFALERNLTFNLNFYRENDCSAAFPELHYSEKRMIDGLIKAFQKIEEDLPLWSVAGCILDRGQLISPHEQSACGVARDYMVIDHHGRVAKCHMEMNRAVTDVDHDNPLTMIRQAKVGVQNPSVNEKEGCRNCEWRYWCTGGCPIATYRATGRYDIKSPNCNIYKTIYPFAVRLEGLRLLKLAKLNGSFQS
jgi:uncharacterized protein